MHRSKNTRYAMFGSLYFSQGTVFAYFTSLNALYFLSKGLSMGDVGIFGAIALIPFVIKIFLGMLSDRVNLLGFGHRKPYIILGLIIQVICLLMAPFIDPASAYWGFVALGIVDDFLPACILEQPPRFNGLLNKTGALGKHAAGSYGIMAYLAIALIII